MKIFLAFTTASAFELAQVTPPPQCPDLDKYELCTSKCAADMDTCKAACNPTDDSCASRCKATALDCDNACPCSSGCPDGCSGCSNAICKDADEHLLIISGKYGHNEDTYLISLATDTNKPASIKYSFHFDIEDSCYAFMSGEHWFLGGFYNPRMIAKLNLGECSINFNQEHLLHIPHVDGMWGSCAVYNDVAHLCFDENGANSNACQTFDGETDKLAKGTTSVAHDWSAMAVYKDKMWTVGGCNPDLNNCHNVVEFFDGTKWSLAPEHPSASIFGMTLLADNNGMYTLGGRPTEHNAQDVYMLTGHCPCTYKWAFIGKMSSAQAGASDFTSGKIISGGIAYAGQNSIEKLHLSDSDFSSTNLGPKADGQPFELYYAAMILVDGEVCIN